MLAQGSLLNKQLPRRTAVALRQRGSSGKGQNRAGAERRNGAHGADLRSDWRGAGTDSSGGRRAAVLKRLVPGASAHRDRGLEPAAVRRVRCATGERGGRLDVAARARCRAARRLDAHCRQDGKADRHAAASLYSGVSDHLGLELPAGPARRETRVRRRQRFGGRCAHLATTAVVEVNRLYQSADRAANAAVDPSLAGAFDLAQAELGVSPGARPARPKHSILDPYFKRAAVDGMTDPYFLETLVVSDLLPFERSFVVAHEWSHLAGFADEGEANFVGWLTCIRGSPAAQYSAWLFLYRETIGALGMDDRRAVADQLAAGPREDLRAIAQRIQQHVSPALAAAGWQVYDRYLKANRVEAGTASYAEVVRLVLGTRFSTSWVPAMRRVPAG